MRSLNFLFNSQIQKGARFFWLMLLLCMQTSCSSHRAIYFQTVDARSKAPVSGVRLVGHAAPGSITLLDFVRPQWTYPTRPEAATDKAGTAVLKVPLNRPPGVQFLDREGNALPIADHAQASVQFTKKGFVEAYVYHSLTEWKSLAKNNSPTRPFVVELKRE